VGRELADEFGFDASDPDALDNFISGIHDSELQGKYGEREPDLVLPTGEELFIPDEGDENLATHIINGNRYIERGPYGIPTEKPSVIRHEGQLYSYVILTDEFGEKKPGRVDMEWDGSKWYRLDEAKMKADGVHAVAGELYGPPGLVAAEADYATEA
jgi:hypothetical protein